METWPDIYDKICYTELLHLYEINEKVPFGLDIYRNIAKDQ